MIEYADIHEFCADPNAPAEEKAEVPEAEQEWEFSSEGEAAGAEDGGFEDESDEEDDDDDDAEDDDEADADDEDDSEAVDENIIVDAVRLETIHQQSLLRIHLQVRLGLSHQ